MVGSFGLNWVGACEEVGEGELGTGFCDGETVVGNGVMC